jgi:hypothetical protein
MLMIFVIVTFIDAGPVAVGAFDDVWNRVVVVDDACLFRNNLSMKFRNGSAADVAKIYREHRLELDESLWRTLFDETVFTSTMIVMRATLRIDGLVSNVLVKRTMLYALTPSHPEKQQALDVFVKSRAELRREIFVSTLLAGHAGIVRSFHCLLSDDAAAATAVAAAAQQQQPLNLATFSRGGVAHQMLRGLVYDNLNDMLVVEQLPLLSDALVPASTTTTKNQRKRRRKDGNKNNNNNNAMNEDVMIVDLSNAFDRLSVALSIVKLIHWLVTTAPGAPFLICDVIPQSFGLYRDVDSRLRARLVDFANMHSATYALTKQRVESCTANNCLGCVGSRDPNALKYQKDRGKCVNSVCATVPVDESTYVV